ncbi:MAG: hypothetical protein BGO98_04235 [Myxococcales bacterium 68-20]|nr:MAG: hypothetical protein BGO98_04235 [Myxococcales bacterium 68-20]
MRRRHIFFAPQRNPCSCAEKDDPWTIGMRGGCRPEPKQKRDLIGSSRSLFVGQTLTVSREHNQSFSSIKKLGVRCLRGEVASKCVDLHLSQHGKLNHDVHPAWCAGTKYARQLFTRQMHARGEREDCDGVTEDTLCLAVRARSPRRWCRSRR